MTTMDKALMELFRQGIISEEVVELRIRDKKELGK